MLCQLYIENVAVIEKAEINFDKGFEVLTGETGAGKSILIDSINAVLGERTSRELIRTGAPSAYVSALFCEVGADVVQLLQENGYDLQEGMLLLQRTIHADGKNMCKVNGRPATVSFLKELGTFLINIHGQHESYHLLSADLHVQYIDRMAHLEMQLDEYRDQFRKLRALKQEKESIILDEEQKARQLDLLNYQISELETANLQIGEQEALTQRRDLYRNSEKIAKQIAEVISRFEGWEESSGILSSLQESAQALREAESFLPDLPPVVDRIQAAFYDLQDCSSELNAMADQLEYNPEELEQLEQRLDELYRLSLKYGQTEEEMLSFLEKCQAEKASIEYSEERLQELEKKYQKTKEIVIQQAEKISEQRRKYAGIFVKRVKEELEFLNMPHVVFQVLQERCSCNLSGCDKIEFLISTNPGEPPKPLAKIASGGELSRIMLAIKTVLAEKDPVGTLIFDEVDTGISGGAAQKVGLKLLEVSGNRQVICVTHLAQIAALADDHFLIRKTVKDQKTSTGVEKLDFEGRKQELARIMGGMEITDLMLKNAEQMLRKKDHEGKA